MPIPPPSIILILVLGGVDVLWMLGVASMGGQGARQPTGSAYSDTLVFLAELVQLIFFAHAALKAVSLFGLYLARRWAVIMGVLPFAISWPLLALATVGFDSPVPMLAAVAMPPVLFLACTLPHWSRMTWRFP